MEARVKSGWGFYVGDICYVLSNEVYHGVWGGNGYKDGIYEDTKTGRSFAVARTAWGDGSYCDGEGHIYGVDAGVIGIVPLELVHDSEGIENGRAFVGEGEAVFNADDGVFDIELPSGEAVHIDTNGEEDWEDEEEYDDDWDDYDRDYEPEDGDIEIGFDPYLGCYTDDV